VRDSTQAAVADLGECRPEEAAFCYLVGRRARCAPTMEACAARASAVTGVTTACEERK
jgi:hypothetical protein